MTHLLLIQKGFGEIVTYRDKIHYVWFGGKDKSDLVNICISSWRRKYSSHQIIEWNENNVHLVPGLTENRFFIECLKRKLWAYAADVARVYILYHEGGIYFDTDVEVVNAFIVEEDKLYLGYEDEKSINGAVLFSCPKNIIIKDIINFYEKEIWTSNLFTLPSIVTEIIRRKGVNIDGRRVENREFVVLESQFFYPYHYTETFDYDKIDSKCYTIHWWGKSWHLNDRRLDFLRYKHIKGWKKSVINILLVTKIMNLIRGSQISKKIKRKLSV